MNPILAHFKGEEEFVKRMMAIIEQVENLQSYYLTEFLSPFHQSILVSLVGRVEGIKVEFEGSIENAEMKRGYICPDYFEVSKKDYDILMYRIHYPAKFEKIKHSDILGALMSLGIKRERFGDIVVGEKIYLVCDTQVGKILEYELTSIRHAKVRLIQSVDVVSNRIEYITRTFFIKSYRIDVILSSFYKLSRSEVNKYIQAGFVKVNHKEVVENNFLCNNNDVISFKRHGRVKLVDLERTTKQGNHVVEGYFYK